MKAIKIKYLWFIIASLVILVSYVYNQNTNISTNKNYKEEASVIGAGSPFVTNMPVNGKFPEMAFEEETHDFGSIDQGEIVDYDFEFENTGSSDLIIRDDKGSCGCTVPEYPKAAIKPGETSNIKILFNSTGKSGEQTKSVTLFCNTKEGKKVLHIKSNIEVPEKD